ncbi:unnamed protein product [Lactuca virosa]|uniref:Uncharacterized protein n=1 Tax=Lactuca virosa TaxID=75947 RepID=A0AAU9NJN7_9ASTR|nr:unnamed protein product [Lactuca virosa]
MYLVVTIVATKKHTVGPLIQTQYTDDGPLLSPYQGTWLHSLLHIGSLEGFFQNLIYVVFSNPLRGTKL